MDNEDKLERGKVLARIIIEILGAPKEHIEKTIKMYMEKLKENDKLEFVKESFNEAVQNEDGKLFTTFAEAEIWFENIYELIGFCFDSLPSSVEILEPSSFKLEANGMTGMINELQAKLHKIDMDLKQARAEKTFLNNRAMTLTHNVIILSVKDKPKTKEELGEETGVKEKLMDDILDKMVEAGKIQKEGNLYKAK